MRLTQSFILNAHWEKTSRGLMVTVGLADAAIHPDCMPPGVYVDEIFWSHRDRNGCVPVRLVRKSWR